MDAIVTDDEGRRGKDEKRLVSVGVGVTIAVALLTVALIFSNAFGASQVAENARDLHWANSTLGSASLARAAVAQAIVFSVDEKLGVADPVAAATARDEAKNGLEAFTTQLGATENTAEIDGLQATARAFAVAGNVVMEGVQSDPHGAAELRQAEMEPAYQALNSELGDFVTTVFDRIDANEAIAGRVGGITRILVMLLIPGIAILLYRTMAKRQLAQRREQMTAKLRAERELSRAKDEFIANISHEIRTPLTTIYGFSEILVDQGLIDPDSAMELIALINTESAELSRMVEDLLTAARLDAGALNFGMLQTRILETVQTVVAPFERNEANITVSCPDVEVVTDRLRLGQVLRNLLSNAVKHGGPGIAVRGTATHDGRLRLVVADDGPGLTPDVEERMFERFVHRGSEPLLIGSVGLGLAIAKSVMELLEGDLIYERVDGETRFIVDLPLATDQTPYPEDAVRADMPDALDYDVGVDVLRDVGRHSAR